MTCDFWRREIHQHYPTRKYFTVSRKADQIQKQCLLFSVGKMTIEGNLDTTALVPNKGLLIHEGNSNSLLLQ